MSISAIPCGSESRKTRIETELACLLRLTRPSAVLVEVNPEKQGLKLKEFWPRLDDKASYLVEVNPEKQGLKLTLPHSRMDRLPSQGLIQKNKD